MWPRHTNVVNDDIACDGAGSSECLDDTHDDGRSPLTPDRQIQHRANTTMHVCWHRNTSVSMSDHNTAVEVSALEDTTPPSR